MSLLAERDVSAHVAPLDVYRAQDAAQARRRVGEVTREALVGDLRGHGLRVEAGPHGSFERDERVLVHHLDGLLLEGGRESVGIVLHAIEQQPRGLFRTGPGRLPRLDPAAIEVPDEPPDEPSWLERGLEGGFQRISPPWFRSRPPRSCRHFCYLLVNAPSIVREPAPRTPSPSDRLHRTIPDRDDRRLDLRAACRLDRRAYPATPSYPHSQLKRSMGHREADGDAQG